MHLLHTQLMELVSTRSISFGISFSFDDDLFIITLLVETAAASFCGYNNYVSLFKHVKNVSQASIYNSSFHITIRLFFIDVSCVSGMYVPIRAQFYT